MYQPGPPPRMHCSRASSDMMSLTAEHEMKLAQRMVELGMTR